MAGSRSRIGVPPPGVGAVLRCERTTPGGPRREQRQPRAQDGSLEFVQPAVDAGFNVMVPVALPSIPQPAQSRSEGGIARNHGATVTEGSQVLRRVEAEHARMRSRAEGTPRFPRGALAAVLDDRQLVSSAIARMASCLPCP